MKFLSFGCPTAERLVTTIFWTLFFLSITFVAYGFAVSYGFTPVGSFTGRGSDPDELAADTVALFSTVFLFVVAVWIRRWSRSLARLGIYWALFAFLKILLTPRIH